MTAAGREQRLYMLALLRSVGSGEDPDVVRVLYHIARKGVDWVVAAVAAAVFSQLMDEEGGRMIREASVAFPHGGAGRGARGDGRLTDVALPPGPAG